MPRDPVTRAVRWWAALRIRRARLAQMRAALNRYAVDHPVRDRP